MTSRPLDGVRIADFSRILAGPFCTMVLGDLGADVVKVEHPEGGDDTRAWGPPFRGDDAAYFLAVNRNKRSVTLDLDAAEDVELARRLVARSDVVIENFRPGVMDRFGLGYEQVAATHPAIVYCSIPGFSDEGSRDRAAYDLMMQAYSGFMSITGHAGAPPVRVGAAVLDVIAGLYAATGILAALREREETGHGTHVSVSLFDASVAALVNQAANHLIGGVVPGRHGSGHPNIVPYQAFETSDRPLVLAAGNDKLFRLTCEAIGEPELADDPRFRSNAERVDHRDALVERLTTAFRREPLTVWLDRLQAAGVPCAPVRDLGEVFSSPEGSAAVHELDDAVRGTLRTVASPLVFGAGAHGQRTSGGLAPPRLGQHDDAIRAELAAEPPTRGDEQ